MRHLLLALLLLQSLGCAQMMGALRRDLDDGGPDTYADAPPTTGGRWAERGFLAESSPEGGAYADRSVGHNDRRPSSDESGVRDGESGWNQGARPPGASDEEGSATVGRVDPNVKRQYKNGNRATRADFVDEAQNEGSLWASDGQTNYYLTKNKIRGLGDIIQLTAEADLVRDIGLEARRSLTPIERNYELLAAQERIRARVLGLPDPTAPKKDGKDQVASSAAAPAPAPAAGAKDKDGKEVAKAEEPEIPVATPADVDVGRSLDIKATDIVMGEIIERYPNGNYKIRATKKVPYKGGAPRLVTVTGVVKGSDISEEDTVGSGKLYEYRVDVAR